MLKGKNLDFRKKSEVYIKLQFLKAIPTKALRPRFVNISEPKWMGPTGENCIWGLHFRARIEKDKGTLARCFGKVHVPLSWRCI